MDQVTAQSARAGLTFVARSNSDVARSFGEYEMVEPGLVPVLNWRPDGTAPKDPAAAYYRAAVGRK